MSLIIPNAVNFQRFGAKKNRKIDFCPTEDSNVIIQRGTLLSGVFNKPIVGSAAGGLIHIIYKECSSLICSAFLSTCQYILN